MCMFFFLLFSSSQLPHSTQIEQIYDKIILSSFFSFICVLRAQPIFAIKIDQVCQIKILFTWIRMLFHHFKSFTLLPQQKRHHFYHPNVEKNMRGKRRCVKENEKYGNSVCVCEWDFFSSLLLSVHKVFIAIHAMEGYDD